MSKRASYVSSSTYILISFRRPVDGLAMLSYWKKTPCPRRAGQGGEAAERYGGGDNGERPARWIAVLQPQAPCGDSCNPERPRALSWIMPRIADPNDRKPVGAALPTSLALGG